MSAARNRLALRPELCDRCGICVRACSAGYLRVGAGYIYVDVNACDGCFSCADACPRGAISRNSATGRGARLALEKGATGGKVVVRSRAEAKALRKIAETSSAGETQRARPATPPEVVFGPVRWGALDAIAVASVLALTLLLQQLLLGSAAVGLMPPAGRVAVRAGALALFYAVQLGLLAVLARRHGVPMRRAFRLQPDGVNGRAIALSVGLVGALLVGTRIVSTLWGGLAQSAGWAPPASEALTGVFGGGGAGLALAVLMVVVIGPLTEELVFRGVIASALASRFGLWPAVLGSAAIFSAYHWTAWVALPTFTLGCALAWLALTRRTLLPSIVLHVLYNGVVVAVAFWLPSA